MTTEISNDDNRKTSMLLDGILRDSEQCSILLTGNNDDKRRIAERLSFEIGNDPAVHVALVGAIIGILSQETDRIDVDMRDAAIALLQQPAIADLLPVQHEALFRAYCEALNRQTSENDPFSGSIAHLLEAGMFLTPYFPQDDLTREQLKHLLHNVAGQFSGAEREHIAGYIPEMLERMTFSGARDARVLYWREQKLKNKEIAQKLGVKDHSIEQSVGRLMSDGKLRGRREGVSAELLSSVKEFRNQGYTNVNIANKLNVGEATLKEAVSQLVTGGEIDARMSKVLPLVDIDLDTRVEQLMKSGMKPRHIIASLPEAEWSIKRSIGRVRIKIKKEKSTSRDTSGRSNE